MEAAEYEKMCAYCEYACRLYEGEHMLCKKRGVVAAQYSCAKFIYDPMKRTVRRSKPSHDELLHDE